MAAVESSSFSRQLRRLRETAGMTQAELAEKAGISVKAVSALESGRRQRPYPSTVRALAAALGLPEEEHHRLTRLVPERGGEPPDSARQVSLPTAPSALIGREQELADIIEWFDREGARLITLTGPGGVGKTRLALEVASQQVDAYSGRVTFVLLASQETPALALLEIAHAVGLQEMPGVTPTDRLASHFGQQAWLLVLDNLEHLIEIAPELATLLAACPELRILATSRAPLKIRAEREYVVRPLALPDLSQIPVVASVADSSAVQLFIDRARAAVPHFELTQANCAAVAAICRRLDGLPLALELVAARIRVLNPTELLARLEYALPLLTGGSRDLPERQQTLQAAIDWSYQLLGETEQELFRSLSTFHGGWMLDAAEHVSVSDEIASGDILDLLASLAEQSLIVADTGSAGATRYRMLETIREYAARRRDEAGETVKRCDRHITWCLALAAEANAGLHGPDQHRWLLRLDEEHENLRAALTWSQQDPARKHLELQLASSLWLFWETRGHLIEGRHWLEQALADANDQPAELRANALNGAGNLAYDQGDHARAAAFHQQSLDLRRQLGDELAAAYSLLNLGNVVLDQGSLNHASELYAEALQLFRTHGSAWDVANALNNHGIVLGARGDYERATTLLEEAIALREPLAEAIYQARSLDALGEVMRKKGDLSRARSLHEESVALRRTRGDARGVAVSLRNLGLVAFYQGELDEARGLIEEALEICRRIENRKGMALCMSVLARIDRAGGDDESATRLYLDALAMHRQLGIHDGVADILVGLAALEARQLRAAQAARLLGASEMVRETTGQIVAEIDRPDVEAVIASIQDAQPPDAFERSREAGRALAIEQAIDQALAAARGNAA